MDVAVVFDLVSDPCAGRLPVHGPTTHLLMHKHTASSNNNNAPQPSVERTRQEYLALQHPTTISTLSFERVSRMSHANLCVLD